MRRRDLETVLENNPRADIIRSLNAEEKDEREGVYSAREPRSPASEGNAGCHPRSVSTLW